MDSLERFAFLLPDPAIAVTGAALVDRVLAERPTILFRFDPVGVKYLEPV